MLLTCYSNTVVMSALIGWFKKPQKNVCYRYFNSNVHLFKLYIWQDF